MHLPKSSGELALPFLTVAIAFAIYLLLMAFNLLSIQRKLEPLTNSQMFVARLNVGNLQSLTEEFSDSRQDLEHLSDSLRPIRWIGQDLTAVPIISSSSRAVTNLVDRLADDLSTFDSTIQSVDRANKLMSRNSDASKSSAPLDRKKLADDLNELREIWSNDLTAIREVGTNYPASWPLESQFIRIAAAENDLATVSEWGIQLLDSASNLLILADEVNELFLSTDNFEDSIIASDQAVASMLSLQESALNERTALESAVADMPDLLKGLPLVNDLNVLLEAVRVAEKAVTGSSIMATIFNDLVQESGDQITGTLTPRGPIEYFAVGLSARTNEIRRATILLQSATENSSKLSGLFSVTTAARFESVLRKSTTFTSKLAAIAPALPQLVGADESTKYLVLGQTTDELRANGGFASSAWELDFTDGGIGSILYMDVLQVDDLDNLTNYPPPPDALLNHMNAPVWMLRDSTWNPDFPSSARTALELYELGQGKKLSNVVGINTSAISRIIEAIGGIDVRGERITSRDITRIIESETDQHGTVYLQVIFDSILRELVAPMSRVEFARFTYAIFLALESKEIIIYASDPQFGDALHDARWDGSNSLDSRSRYYVVDSNIGWNKVDRNIVRSSSYDVDFQLDGSAIVTVVASYKNQSGDHPPFLNCDRQWHPQTRVYAALLNGCYWNYIQIYGPENAVITQADSMALPAGAAYVEFGNGLPNEPTLTITSTPHGLAVQGLIAIPKGDVRELTFKFVESNVWVPENEKNQYDLELRTQPGIQVRNTDITFRFPDGYQMSEIRTAPRIVESKAGQYSFELREDTSFRVQFGRN